VIAIRDPALRMRALLADYRLFSSALILVPSTRIWQAPCNGLVLETLVIHPPHSGWWPVSRFTLFMSIRNEVSCPILLVEALGTRFDSRPHTVAKAETTGYVRAFRRACD